MFKAAANNQKQTRLPLGVKTKPLQLRQNATEKMSS